MIQFMYMYTITDIVLSISICLVWISVWKHSYSIDKRLLGLDDKSKGGEKADIKVPEDNDSVQRHVSLPNDSRLVVYSGGLIFLLTVFYTIIYNRIDISFWGLIDSRDFVNAVSLVPIRIFAVIVLLIGSVLIKKAREKLSMLTSREVIFALNNMQDKKVYDGVYRHMHHPMYVGIILVTLASLVLLPSVLGACILIGGYFCLWMKTVVEKSAIKQ